MRIRDEFATEFSGLDISTKDVLDWYNQRLTKMGNKPTTHRSNLYVLILHPLLEEGRAVRLAHGLFHICDVKEKAKERTEKELEFDRYLQSKLESSD